MKANKKVLIITLAIAMALGFTSCSGGTGSNSNGSQPVANAPDSSSETPADQGNGSGGRTLVYSHFRPSTPEQQVNIDKYFTEPLQAAFPNDTITVQSFDTKQTLQVQIAGGSGPDVFGLDGPTEAILYAQSGRLVDLTPYAEKYGWEDKFFDWAYKASLYDNKLYSLPNSFEGIVMYYNLDVFKENGWDIPTNESELLDVMKKAQAAGIIPITFGNSDYAGAVDWLYSTFLSCNAGPDFVKDVLQGRKKWTDQLGVDAINKMVSWWQEGYIGDKASQAITNDDMVAQFATGKGAMMINGTWATDLLMTSYADVNWSIETIPELRSGVGRIFPLAIGGGYAVNASCKDPDFAAEVLNQLFTDVDTHMLGVREANRQPFPLKTITVDNFKGMDPRMVGMYDMLMEAQASGDVGLCAWTFFPNNLRDYMNDNTDGLFLGMLTVDEYLEKMQELTDEAIATGEVPIIP